MAPVAQFTSMLHVARLDPAMFDPKPAVPPVVRPFYPDRLVLGRKTQVRAFADRGMVQSQTANVPLNTHLNLRLFLPLVHSVALRSQVCRSSIDKQAPDSPCALELCPRAMAYSATTLHV